MTWKPSSFGWKFVILGLVLLFPADARAQEIPLLPTTTAPKQDDAEPPHDAVVAESSGPISVDEVVADDAIQNRLRSLLPRLRGVRSVDVTVDDGVVSLAGHVEDSEARDRLRDFALRVEGVNLVINQTRTDAQVLTARELLVQRLERLRNLVERTWLPFLVAIAVFLASVYLAKLFTRWSDLLLTPVFPSVLMRSVAASVMGLAIVLAGLFAALEILGVARAVLSVVGLAGAVALALSFAFRDFAENFIASLLLGIRRPFGVGDVLEVAGFMGVVRALNTRATVLVTAEGNQVRIPNAMVFKNVMVNRTASDAKRYSFDVLIASDASVAEAQKAIGDALAGHDGLLQDPKPRALVQELEPGGVRLRGYFWLPGRGVDDLKLQSDARLRARVALREAGVQLPQASMSVRLIHAAPGTTSRPDRQSRLADAAREEAEAREHQRIDAKAAAESSASKDAQPSAFDQALEVARDLGGDEGDNLLSPDKD